MKIAKLLLAAALAVATTSPALAQSGSMPMKAMPSMSSSMKHGNGVGVIKAIDARAGTVTIQHGPIAAVSWPAMTMTFKAKPALLKGLKVGQTVAFECDVQSMNATVTAVRPK